MPNENKKTNFHFLKPGGLNFQSWQLKPTLVSVKNFCITVDHGEQRPVAEEEEGGGGGDPGGGYKQGGCWRS